MALQLSTLLLLLCIHVVRGSEPMSSNMRAIMTGKLACSNDIDCGADGTTILVKKGNGKSHCACVAEGDMMIEQDDKRAALPLSRRRIWNNDYSDGRYNVPFAISSHFLNNGQDTAEATALLSYINAFGAKTNCIRFVRKAPSEIQNSEALNFISDGGCYSYLGRTTLIPQPLSIGNGCNYRGIVEHELLHALGFFHEQSRLDRDDFITIVSANIISGFERQFEKRESDAQGTDYDKGSVMHYNGNAFGNGKTTIIDKETGTQFVAQRDGASATDIYELNKLYGCLTPVPTTTSITTTEVAVETTKVTPVPTTTSITTTEGAVETTKVTPVPTTTSITTTEGAVETTKASSCVILDVYKEKYCARKTIKRGFCMGKNAARCRKSCLKNHGIKIECKDTKINCKRIYAKGKCSNQNKAAKCVKSCNKCCESPTTTTSTTTTTVAVPTTATTTAVAVEQTCGLSMVASQPANKIIGGVNAEVKERPYSAMLKQHETHFYPFCGGSVIDTKYILTAAHCVDLDLNFVVIVGGHDLNNRSNEVVHQVEKVIKHENYDSNTLDNDIALVKIAGIITFNDYVQPICLNTQEVVNGDRMTVSGWGKTSTIYSNSRPNVLQEVSVTAISTVTCDKDYYDNYEITNNMFCAAETGKDSCQGDSGGPIVKVENDRYHLVGIVSWGIGCALQNYPGVYTKVSNYIDWINGQY